MITTGRSLVRTLFQNKLLWLIAFVISSVLLAILLTQMDHAAFVRIVKTLEPNYLIAALAFLIGEAIFTSLRIKLFASDKPAVTDALYANGWYMILLNMLPARLGEVAAIWVFEKYLGQTRGAAMISIIAQRLFDIIMLSVLFLIVLGMATAIVPSPLLIVIALLLVCCAVGVLLRLEQALSIIAATMLQRHWRFKNWRRVLLRLVLQARTWRRHNIQSNQMLKAIALTLLKWTCNLGIVSCLLFSVDTPLSWPEALSISAAYNYLAIVPVQTIGGLGLSEAGLALMLGLTGIATAEAIAFGVFARIVILLFPFVFFVVVWGNRVLRLGVFSQVPAASTSPTNIEPANKVKG